MTRINNVATSKKYDNVHYNNVAEISINHGLFLTESFYPKNDKLFGPVFVFHRDMSVEWRPNSFMTEVSIIQKPAQ